MPSELTPELKATLPAVSSRWPTDTLDDILEACDPGEALLPDDSRRVDLESLRHGRGIQKFQKAFRLKAPGGRFHHGLLCGHRGSGKSTELLRLQDWAGRNGFLAVWEPVDVHFGMIDLDYSDLFLMAATMAERALRDQGYPLPEEKVRRVMLWFRDVIQEDSDEYKSEIGAEVGGQLGGKLPLGLGALFAKLTAGWKGASSHATRIRETLRRYPETLITYTNDLLDTANTIVRDRGNKNGLLLIFDNLDRYDPAQIDKVLVRSSRQMLQMSAHTLFTFPISLAYNPISGRVTADYSPCVTLPMVAVRRKDDAWAETVLESPFDQDAIEALRGLLAERIELDRLFARPQEDVETLIKMSGGSIRDLIQMVASAATFTEEEIITTEAVQDAVNELRGTYMRLMANTPHDYRCLAIHARREPMSTAEGDQCATLSRLIFRGCLLEYMEDEKPWYDVHPVLIDTEEMRHARNAAKTSG